MLLVKSSKQISKFNIAKRIIESTFRLIDVTNPIIPIHDRNICLLQIFAILHSRQFSFLLSPLQNHILLF